MSLFLHRSRTLSRSALVTACAIVLVASSSSTAFSAVPTIGPAATDGSDDDQSASQPAATDSKAKLYDKVELARGFFIASDIGVSLVFGGAVQPVSDAEPYVGINIGYDLNRWFSLDLHVGHGFAGSAARTANEDGRLDNFGFTNLCVGALFWIRLSERFALEIKAQGGVSFLDPVPFDPAVDNVTVPSMVPVLGGGLALKYLTLLTDFTLGIDVTFNYILTANLPTLVISPTVRYTF